MKQLKQDFMLGEFRRLSWCLIGFLLCLLLIWLVPSARQQLLAFIVYAVVVLAVAYRRAVRQLRDATDPLWDAEKYRIDQEYPAPHPIYKVAYGELHLLPGFLISRNKGRLLILPLEQVQAVERRSRSVGIVNIPLLRLTMENGRSTVIDFSVRDPAQAEPVFRWLADRLDAEKLRFSL